MVDLRAGERLGAYRLDALLGRGGMGEVWRVERVELPADAAPGVAGPFALKVALDPALARVLRHEDELLRRLDHPAIVHEVELVREHEPPFLVMELARGETARALLRDKGTLAPEVALAVFLRVLDGVAHAHGRGVVHRDLKPENVIVDPQDLSVKITDFGLGKAKEEALPLLLSRSVLTLGAEGIAGTLEYMPPEQRRGGAAASPTLDVYALGVLLYELLVGELPLGAFRLPTEIDPAWPTTLDKVVERALSPRPEARFPDAAALRQFVTAGLAREGFEVAAPGQPRVVRPPSAVGRGGATHPTARTLSVASSSVAVTARIPEPAPRPSGPAPAQGPSGVAPAPATGEAPPIPALAPPAPTPQPTGLLFRARKEHELAPVALRSCVPATNPPSNLRARVEADARSSPGAPAIHLALDAATYEPGSEVRGTVLIHWPFGELARSVRFRSRGFARAVEPGRVENPAGERARGLLWDEEGVLAGAPGPISLGRRVAEAFQVFAHGEGRSALATGVTEIPFALELPRTMPVSFRGELFEVAHVLLARIDVPLGIDHDALAPLDVVAPGKLAAIASTAAGERGIGLALGGVEAGKIAVELRPRASRPDATPAKHARIALVREESIERRGQPRVARRTPLSRGSLQGDLVARARRVFIECEPVRDVRSFTISLAGSDAIARVRTLVEARLFDALGRPAGEGVLELGWT